MIRIISDSERNKFEFQGSTFYYRRISMAKAIQLTKEHTKRGRVNQEALGIEMLRWCLLGWEDVADENGEPVAFSQELVSSLPPELIDEFTPLLREAKPERDEMGN